MGEPRPSQSPAVTAIALSVTCGDSSPRGRAKKGEPRRESQGHLASPLGRGGRAKRGRRGHLASPFGRGGRAKRGRRGHLASPFGRGGRAKRGRRGRGRCERSVNGTLFYFIGNFMRIFDIKKPSDKIRRKQLNFPAEEGT